MVENVAILIHYQGFFAFLCGKSMWSHLAYVVVHGRYSLNNGTWGREVMKSTPRRRHRAWLCVRACQDKGETSFHHRAAKRVRACSGY